MKPLTFDEAQQRSRVDHFSKMGPGDLGFVRIVRQCVGVVAESGYLDAVLLAECADIVGLRLREPVDVDVANAAVRPIFFGLGPAHDLDALVTDAGGGGEHLVEREVAENRADET